MLMSSRYFLGSLTALALFASVAPAEARPAKPTKPATVCADCVRANMVELTGAAMQGRQCGSPGEVLAARYLEAELKRAGVRPAYPTGFIQPLTMATSRLAAAPQIGLSSDPALRWTHGEQFVVVAAPHSVSGRLVRLTTLENRPDVRDAVVFYDSDKPAGGPGRAELYKAGAVAVIEAAPQRYVENWD